MFTNISTNLGSIGHGGNGANMESVYSAMFSEVRPLSVNQLLSESHTIKMLTLGLDSIFSAASSIYGQSFRSVLQFADLSGSVSGFSVPLASIFSSKGKSSGRVSAR
ncbi:hypothetical protein OCHUTO_0552 [Orientia chuto str. Dubai]|uniref:Uncharacterized protein n=1 Tax=Orientia chuto str. Dubai TaxID=1359168 RepID=A0A0F3MKC2_9RICK|nr:hypothetical protein [Candidatus Orientia mediorientalis]KJV56185.1 hypothetical protein OCHUTO_0552 [Orientia chuto str. Dubai]